MILPQATTQAKSHRYLAVWGKCAGVWVTALWLGVCRLGLPEDVGWAAEPAHTPPLVVSAAGERFAGNLVGADEQWRLRFAAGEAERTLPAAELVRWGDFAELSQGPVIVLADGSLLVADLLAVDGETLTVDSLLLGSVKLPLESLAGLVLRLPAAPRQRDRVVDETLLARGNADQLVLENGDRLEGLFLGLNDGADPLSPQRLRFRRETTELSIEIQRVSRLVFNPLLRVRPKAEGLRGWVGLADGSRLLVRRLRLDAGQLELRPALLDQTWQAHGRSLVALQPLGGRVVYLSDLEPAGYRHVPYLTIAWPYRRDRQVLGGWLRAAGRLYLKGLGMHSAARLTYLLDGTFERFESELALDDVAQGGGSVEFRIYVDGTQRYRSPLIQGEDQPLPVSVDLRGAKRLDLIVGFGRRADVLDRADWLDARLVRTRQTAHEGQEPQ